MDKSIPRGLDKTRLVMAYIMVSIGACVAGFSFIFVAAGISAIGEEDGGIFAGFFGILFAIVFLISAIYLAFGIMQVKKCRKNENTPLSERNTSIALTILKMILSLASVFFAIFPIIYLICDLIEVSNKNSLSGVVVSQTKFKTDSPLEQSADSLANPNTKHFCVYCGKEIHSQYTKFCENCGKEIEFRK